MPLRKTPLVNEQIYHVFNRSVAQLPIFRNSREFGVFLNLIEYYKFTNPPMRYSYFARLLKEERNSLLEDLYKKSKYLVNIFSFTVMPNHYHLLLKQTESNGIMNFIRLMQNSYAHHINIKNKRSGSVFQSPFKAVRIENDEQFLHVARYIHLNPLTTYLIKSPDNLESYEWSSFKDYVGKNPRRFVDTLFLNTFFKDIDKLKTFTLNQVDYQRKLNRIKHLVID